MKEFISHLEDALESLLSKYLFEPNNEKTRSAIMTDIDNFMESLQKDGIICEWKVCDATNNPSFIDRNEVRIDLTVDTIPIVIELDKNGVSFEYED